MNCIQKSIGVDVSKSSIIAELPEIGRFDDAKLFAMAGLAPVEKQSGDKEWRRKIYGGRQRVRSALYMSAIACLSHNTILREYYQKKRDEGHPFKWCIVPVMRLAKSEALGGALGQSGSDSLSFPSLLFPGTPFLLFYLLSAPPS